MTAAFTKLPAALDAPRTELARLCRRICLEAERDSASGRSFEAEFTSALADVQLRFGHECVNDDDLWEIVREEEKRVADASAVAELLLPKISALLQRHPPTPLPQSRPAVSPSVAPHPSSRSAPASDGTPAGIADLLQGMLDLERTDPNRSSSKRT